MKAAGGGGVSSSRSKLGESSKALEKELAEIYVCPISLELMSDPVMAADGKERRVVRADIMLRSLPRLHAQLANTLSTPLVTAPLHVLCSLVSSRLVLSCLLCDCIVCLPRIVRPHLRAQRHRGMVRRWQEDLPEDESGAGSLVPDPQPHA